MSDERKTPSSEKSRLIIRSFEELLENEKEILERISEMPNGGYLFLVNPFLLLKDVGVHLSDRVKSELIKKEPTLSAVSSIPYNSLKMSVNENNFRIHLRGLFRRDGSS